MPEFGITSISHELGREVSLEDAKDALLSSLAETFQLELPSAPSKRIA
jgi:hypothetical protein